MPNNTPLPSSLKNIFKELSSDLNFKIPDHGNLSSWAKQGVLLLNSSLTVRAKQAGSHQKKGWEQFTNYIIQEISNKKEGIVFILWGRFAQEKIKFINIYKHHVLETSHPSPLSAYNGFLGCKHFSKTNNILLKQHITPIKWQI